jgi:lipopolysaccharide/colanic/teichoic acid biosynthesis glycosyltransferase
MIDFYQTSSVISDTLEKPPLLDTRLDRPRSNEVCNLVRKKRGHAVFQIVKNFVDKEASKSIVITTSDSVNKVLQSKHQYDLIVNLCRLNDETQLCHFLGDINRKLVPGGQMICCLETTRQRRERIYKKHPRMLSGIYYFFDYLLNRAAPAMSGTRWISTLLTRGRNRAISFHEALGRLSYCGFRIENEEAVDGLHYIAVKKADIAPTKPIEDYGLLVSLDRVGENGKIIKVHKFRTMVAFSEYLQQYIYEQNDLSKGGKFHNDKRITILGGLFRKFWFDELPMLANLLKGEIKLVGVRPLSSQYLALYDAEVAHRRVSVKPGLVPPYYADLPDTLEEIQASEMRYIEQWEKAPLKTDVIYFFRVLRNIIWAGIRSK